MIVWTITTGALLLAMLLRLIQKERHHGCNDTKIIEVCDENSIYAYDDDDL